MRYRLDVARAAVRAIESQLPEAVAAAAVEFLHGALLDNPRRVGKPLQAPLQGLHSARRGQYRILYRIDDDAGVITVTSIEHRREAYRS